MILQALVEYYETLERRGEITRPGWCRAKVSFALELSAEGALKRVLSLKREVQRGKKKVWEPQNITVPRMVTRSSGISANFLCDNSSYLLGMDKKGKPERSRDCFQCARQKHIQVLEGVNSPAAQAVTGFFERWDPLAAQGEPALAEYYEEIMEGGNMIFFVNETYVQDDPAVRQAWESWQDEQEGGEEGICLVTGKRGRIERIHGNIKGGQGAQSSGAALVSFNAPAFESYGREQSYNAPVGAYAVYAYTTALNHLLADREHVMVIGDTTVVYWSEDGEQECQDIFSMSMEPSLDNAEIVGSVFRNLAAGRAVNVPGVEKDIAADQKFYILGLAPNAARIAVRFFYRDSFGNILVNLKRHYDRMQIIRPASDRLEYLGIWHLLMETVNRKSKDKKPASGMAGALYQAVISGGRYPESCYQAVLGRVRAEQDDTDRGIYQITRGRAAIIKGWLLRNAGYKEEEITMALNENSRDTAYTLGRMFAVLEGIQEDANPGINATIKDRYFNSACATPASIFPVLLKLKNSQIRKLDSRGKEIYYETMLGELQGRIEMEDGQEAYPRHLTLEEQGKFILGYYHQTQKRFEKKEEKQNGRAD